MMNDELWMLWVLKQGIMGKIQHREPQKDTEGTEKRFEPLICTDYKVNLFVYILLVNDDAGKEGYKMEKNCYGGVEKYNRHYLFRLSD